MTFNISIVTEVLPFLVSAAVFKHIAVQLLILAAASKFCSAFSAYLFSHITGCGWPHASFINYFNIQKSHTSFVFPFKVKSCCGGHSEDIFDLTNRHLREMHFVFGSKQHVASTANFSANPSISCIINLCHDHVCLLAWS